CSGRALAMAERRRTGGRVSEAPPRQSERTLRAFREEDRGDGDTPACASACKEQRAVKSRGVV
ncbi:MAG TPA: hypothetical protein VFH68_21580, partial [Polyangia bacterium]|nr:hypothetical protein [Polyangia bacterium]